MKTAILISTFLRDSLLYKSIQSIVDNYTKDCIILIGDQGRASDKKAQWVLKMKEKMRDSFHYREYPFNCGLSYTRNRLVELAKEKKCDYVFLGSDSFIFNDDFKNICNLMQIIKDRHFDIIGTELIPSICGWEAKLNLIKGDSFELDFIDKKKIHYIGFVDKKGYPINLWDVDIMRNCFLAKTDVLLKTKWDENFKLCEHEDMFWRLKQADVKCGWTDYIILTKQTERPQEYKTKYRDINFREGQRLLKRKHNILGWVTYKNLKRAKENYK